MVDLGRERGRDPVGAHGNDVVLHAGLHVDLQRRGFVRRAWHRQRLHPHQANPGFDQHPALRGVVVVDAEDHHRLGVDPRLVEAVADKERTLEVGGCAARQRRGDGDQGQC